MFEEKEEDEGEEEQFNLMEYIGKWVAIIDGKVVFLVILVKKSLMR